MIFCCGLDLFVAAAKAKMSPTVRINGCHFFPDSVETWVNSELTMARKSPVESKKSKKFLRFFFWIGNWNSQQLFVNVIIYLLGKNYRYSHKCSILFFSWVLRPKNFPDKKSWFCSLWDVVTLQIMFVVFLEQGLCLSYLFVCLGGIVQSYRWNNARTASARRRRLSWQNSRRKRTSSKCCLKLTCRHDSCVDFWAIFVVVTVMLLIVHDSDVHVENACVIWLMSVCCSVCSVIVNNNNNNNNRTN